MSSTNTHLFFCCETDCDDEAHVYGGRCDECFGRHIALLRKEHEPPRCEQCQEVFDSEHSDLLPSESGRFCGKWCEAGYLLSHNCNGNWNAYLNRALCSDCVDIHPHTCSGEIDYEHGHKICDDEDDPRCPQYKLKDRCSDCGVVREETEPELPYPWYCKPCWKNRFTQCADCGSVPENGHFPCYRGSDPLCTDCEEAAYGPPSPVDWRERTGRCSKCDFFYDLISSSDKRDLCYICQ